MSTQRENEKMADSVGTERNTETSVEVLGMKGEGEDKKRKCRL